MLVDEEYIERCNIQGIYPAAYYPHNIHFLWFASSMEGRSEVSIAAARKLGTKTPKAMVEVVPRLERYFTMPYFSLIRFGKWKEVLNEPKPAEDLIYATTMWHYARGMAYANIGKIKKAKKELQLVAIAKEDKTLKALEKPNYPTTKLVDMAALVLKGEIAGKEGNFVDKVAHIRAAVTLQDGLRYSEPPHFYFPVRQALGNALLAANQLAEAEKVFKEDLAKFPKNGWSLFGLHQSLKKQHKTEKAALVKKEFDVAWSKADFVLSTKNNY